MPPCHFANRIAILISPATADKAIDAFLAMARGESHEVGDTSPTLTARNYSAPMGKPYRVRFDLRDPDPVKGEEGDQDHVLFKSTGQTHGRIFKGQRRPQDYQVDRAIRIKFITAVLRDPTDVYRIRSQPSKVMYVARTGEDERFYVLLEELGGQPRFNFIIAYPVTESEFKEDRKGWQKLFPCSPKPPKKKRIK